MTRISVGIVLFEDYYKSAPVCQQVVIITIRHIKNKNNE